LNATVLAALVAFAVALVVTPLVGALARRLGVLDRPGGRKGHHRATPYLGGVAIVLGVAAGFAVGGVAGRFAVVLAATGAVFLVGLADDVFETPVWVRLLVETGAAIAVVASGVHATFLVGAPWVTGPLTVVWILAITNAFNFLDNMDGLSAGVSAIASFMFILVCIETDQPAPAIALAAVGAAALGFLPWNFRTARVFMGDAGALALGFLIGTLSVSMTFYSYGTTTLPLLAPVLVLAIPIFDTASVFWIRMREGRSIFSGDQKHFSHRLVNLGMSKSTAVMTIWLAAAAIGLGATLLKDLSRAGGTVLLVQAAGVFAIIVLMERAGKRET
jgi:UDP-GlcNAc:undecaprenyl-phosphate GlcNAc-1-phosphate transferase